MFVKTKMCLQARPWEIMVNGVVVCRMCKHRNGREPSVETGWHTECTEHMGKEAMFTSNRDLFRRTHGF